MSVLRPLFGHHGGAKHVRHRKQPFTVMGRPPSVGGVNRPVGQRNPRSNNTNTNRRAHLSEQQLRSPLKHAKTIRSKRTLRGTALALTGLLVFGITGAASAASRLTSNIDSVDLAQVMTHERPAPVVKEPIELPETDAVIVPSDILDDDDGEPTAVEPMPTFSPTAPSVAKGAPVNILIMGTDARSGENLALGGGDSTGARSDSTLILHISADREWMAAVAIPRDTIVNIPSCPTSTGKYTAARPATRFNAAFAFGSDTGRDVASGALCTLTTVEAITNIRFDGFVVLDFAGFRDMVDALGGVELDIPRQIRSPLAGDLKLEAGLQTLDGWHALQYARARTGQGLGGGSDLERIGRQQKLLSAMAHQVQDANLLTDSPQLFRFLNATTSSMTASSNYATISGLTELATVLSAVDSDEIDFIMAPVRTNPENPNTVLFAANAKELWAALRYDLRPSMGG
ncbi:MAG: LCP family protein [Promicromonosporaceae bacterium]|nr:LCP family protein [Promicromonosporaceae bacterium]